MNAGPDDKRRSGSAWQGRLDGVAAAGKRRPILALAVLSIALVALYWGLLASDRYVSAAHVVVESTDAGGADSLALAGLLINGSGSSEMLLLRDHLLSVDMMNQLDRELGLRAHYSSHGDWLSRLRAADASTERFHRYYRTRISVELDEYAKVLKIRAQAFRPVTAHAIVRSLVAEGERFMNGMAHELAETQVVFLEKQVEQMSERVAQTNEAIIAFQNETGLASPESTAAALTEITGRIESQLSELRATRSAKLGYLSPRAAEIVQLDTQIRALEQQLDRERARLAAPSGEPLNRIVEASRKLRAEAELAQDIYRTALLALERGRVEATRTIKKVSVVQSPTLPEDAVQPRRLYNTILFAVMALTLAGIGQLLLAIIRDHQD